MNKPLEQFIGSARACIELFFKRFYKVQEVKLNDKKIYQEMEMQYIVHEDGIKIAVAVSNAIVSICGLLDEISIIHTPFLSYSNNDFYRIIAEQVNQNMTIFIQKNILQYVR